MKKYALFYAMLFTFVCIAIMPASTYAAPAPNAFLGGGNALSRANSGESQGLTHATSTSDLLSHLTFASTRGGRSEEVPPPKEDSDGEGSEEATQSSPSPANTSNGHSNANGNASGGNGGNGGGAEAGGLVRAGSVVSNSNAVNVINTNIVRISTR